ncbi:MAG TPA: hypothetical protein VMY06_13240 [Sedimentisphaerales bacterium]|nr:hypothetical protein [Sedimentisphaerales bacterium]
MWDKDKEKALLEVCKKYTADAPKNVIFPEPYLPYIPEDWKGILVLAESQMIKSTDDESYGGKLKRLSSVEKMARLGEKELQYKEGDIGVGPWDNGTIKLALQAIFIGANLELRLEDIAISNAVPWTRKTTGTNLNPDKQMQDKAAEFWEKVLGIWEPDIKAMVVLGNVAERVMTRKGIPEKYTKNWLKLRLPSPNAINRVSGMFDCDDLKFRFQEIQKALDALEMSEEVEQYKMKVFFACHAVSLGLEKFKKWFGGN